jgi:hypothetical protein
MKNQELRDILRTFWSIRESWCVRNRPATEEDIASVRFALGTAVPEDLRWLWSITNGLEADTDNTLIYPTAGAIERTLEGRQHGYPIDAIAVGDDRSDTEFVLRPLAIGRSSAMEVVERCWESTGDPDQSGPSLLSLLWARHAYYGALSARSGSQDEWKVSAEALRGLDAPGPESLHARPFSDDHMNALLAYGSKRWPP